MRDDASRAWKDQYMLRFPDGMRDRLKEEAAANQRSLNAEIVARLNSTLEGNVSDLSAEGFGALIKQMEAVVGSGFELIFDVRDTLPGIEKFMLEQGVDRQEAVRRILKDWLIGYGYLKNETS